MTQPEYIEILANDLGYDRKKRNQNVSAIVNRQINYLDELTTVEAHLVINEFKARKAREQSSSRSNKTYSIEEES